MKKEIAFNIPIPAGERIYVSIIEAWVRGDTLYIKVEDDDYRVATGELPSEATENNITARLLKTTVGRIKRVNPDILVGKQIEVDVVHKCLFHVGDKPIGINAVIEDVIYCETDEEFEEKYLQVARS